MGGDGRLSPRLELPECGVSESTSKCCIYKSPLRVRSLGYAVVKPGITFANHSDDVCTGLRKATQHTVNTSEKKES